MIKQISQKITNICKVVNFLLQGYYKTLLYYGNYKIKNHYFRKCRIFNI